MKRNTSFMRFLRPVAAATLISVLAVSCEKDELSDDDDKNINQIVADADNYSTLEAALVKANLSTTLSGTGPYTVFAPNNDAFAASGVTQANLDALTGSQVQTILLYHVLGSEVEAEDFPAGPNAKVTTASGDSVFVTRNTSGVFINGVKVEEADIDASNGVIHRVGRVLLPPAGTLVETAAIPGGGFDSLVKAVTRAATAPGGDPTMAATLGNATLTIFAPTNAAFTQLLTSLGLTNINDIPIANLLAVLRYHVVPGRVFSSDLTNGTVTMLSGNTTTVNLSNGTNGGATITGTGNGANFSNITRANVMARNGVIHVIDRVLVP